MPKINCVDIVCGLAWGDEAKGKIVSSLLQKNDYDWVCRWCGSHNAGHTIYVNNKKYVTHIVPAGVFYGIKCLIGPECLVNIDELINELTYLKNEGIDTSQVFISKNTHLISNNHNPMYTSCQSCRCLAMPVISPKQKVVLWPSTPHCKHL